MPRLYAPVAGSNRLEGRCKRQVPIAASIPMASIMGEITWDPLELTPQPSVLRDAD